MTDTPTTTEKRYLTGPQTLARYGRKDNMWLWRLAKSDPRWPKPIYIAGKKFYDEAELDAYDAGCRRDPILGFGGNKAGAVPQPGRVS